MNLPDRHLTVAEPDPDYTQQPGRGNYSGKPAPPLAPPTDVYDSAGNRTGETLRMKKFMLRDGRELYIDASGSGRLFKRRQSGLGVQELTPDEAVDLGYAPKGAGDDDD